MKECYISVDIETTGPVPSLYSMYELGACLVRDDATTFSEELTLVTDAYVTDYLTACGRTIGELRRRGSDPAAVMRRFAAWIESVSVGQTPVFVGLNAAFDWMFVSWYFESFVGKNPFGHNGCLDIKAYYAGMTHCQWADAKRRRIADRFRSPRPHTHAALDDAREQAEMFRKMVSFNAART